jgi:uncharacterized protein (DUF697 family)
MGKKLPPLKGAGVGPGVPPLAEATTLELIKGTATPVAPLPQPEAPLPEDAAPTMETAAAPLEETPRMKQARAIAARYRALSAMGGATLVPVIDVAITTGLQLKMLSSLARLYEIPFDKVRARSLVSALIGGAAPQGLAAGAAILVPGPGTVVGMAVGMASAIVSTDTVGKLFIRHFEAGGTLADFPKEEAAA